jgi:hypothetical protein
LPDQVSTPSQPMSKSLQRKAELGCRFGQHDLVGRLSKRDGRNTTSESAV